MEEVGGGVGGKVAGEVAGGVGGGGAKVGGEEDVTECEIGPPTEARSDPPSLSANPLHASGGGWRGGLPRGELTHGEGGTLLEERTGGLIGEGGLFGEGGGLLGLAEAGEGRTPYGQSDPPPHLGGGSDSHDLTPPSAIAAPPQPAEGVARLDGGSPHAEPTREPPLPFVPPLSPPRQPCVAEAPPMPRGGQPQPAPHSRVTTHSTGAIVTTPMTPPYPSHRVNHPPHQFMSLPLAIATQIAADSPKFYHYPRVGVLLERPLNPLLTRTPA